MTPPHKPFKPGDILLGSLTGKIALFLGYNLSRDTYDVYIPELGAFESYQTSYESLYVSRPPTFKLLSSLSSLELESLSSR